MPMPFGESPGESDDAEPVVTSEGAESSDLDVLRQLLPEEEDVAAWRPLPSVWAPEVHGGCVHVFEHDARGRRLHLDERGRTYHLDDRGAWRTWGYGPLDDLLELLLVFGDALKRAGATPPRTIHLPIEADEDYSRS